MRVGAVSAAGGIKRYYESAGLQKQMPKPKTVGKLKQDAAALLQRLVRMKYADHNGMCECVTCGKVGHYKDMDGGHFVSRRWTATLLVEENIHPQCKGCNNFRNGAPDDYALFMIDTYGMEAMRELIDSKHRVVKYTRIDLEDMIADIKAKIKEQEQRLAGV